MVPALLAFFLGIVGADLFYRREFVSGFGVFAILVFGYAMAPLMGENVGGLLHQIPTILVLYGWARAFLYVRGKGL
jgi:hypothetical protein